MTLSVYANAPATAPAPLDIPAPSQRSAATRQVEELHQRQPLQYGPARLLELSQEPTSSPALRYSAALRAMELAADSGRVQLALAALRRLESTYKTDGRELRVLLLEKLLQSPAPTGAAILAIRWSEDAYRANRLNDVTVYAKTVEQCRPELSSELQKAASEYLADYEYAQACSTAAFECLYRGRWQDNLHALGDGSGPLASMAQVDAAAQDKAARLESADQWWTAGEKLGGATGSRISGRAIGIYRELLPTCSGLERELILSRMAEHERGRLRARGYVAGLSREIWRESSPARQGDVAIDLEIAKEAKEDAIPRTGAHVLYRGFLLVTAPGPHEITLTAGSALKMLVDGKGVMDDPVIYRKRSGAKVVLELDGGLHEIELEVSSSSSKPRLHAEWITPGANQKHQIPQGSFFYDPLPR